MKMDFSKLTGHVHQQNHRNVAPSPPRARNAPEDWLAMFRKFDIHVSLYCASSDLERWEALEALNEKLAKCAASLPDALVCLERERARIEGMQFVQPTVLTHGRYERRKAAGNDRRAKP
jgi:hypothetical protein